MTGSNRFLKIYFSNLSSRYVWSNISSYIFIVDFPSCSEQQRENELVRTNASRDVSTLWKCRVRKRRGVGGGSVGGRGKPGCHDRRKRWWKSARNYLAWPLCQVLFTSLGIMSRERNKAVQPISWTYITFVKQGIAKNCLNGGLKESYLPTVGQKFGFQVARSKAKVWRRGRWVLRFCREACCWESIRRKI